MAKHYNGYQGRKGQKIYTPWSVVKYLKAVYLSITDKEDVPQPKDYWDNSGTSLLINKLFSQMKGQDLEEFKALSVNDIQPYKGGRLFSTAKVNDLIDKLTAQTLEKDVVYYLLECSGYIVWVKGKGYRLPNQEVEKHFRQSVLKQWLIEHISLNVDKLVDELCKALFDSKQFTKILKERVLTHQKGEKNESTFHSLCFALLEFVAWKTNGFVKVFTEFSAGPKGAKKKIDTLVISQGENNESKMIIFEYKEGGILTEKEATNKLQEALWQVHTNDYLSAFEYNKVKCTGVIVRPLVFYQPTIKSDTWDVLMDDWEYTTENVAAVIKLFSTEKLIKALNKVNEDKQGKQSKKGKKNTKKEDINIDIERDGAVRTEFLNAGENAKKKLLQIHGLAVNQTIKNLLSQYVVVQQKLLQNIGCGSKHDFFRAEQKHEKPIKIESAGNFVKQQCVFKDQESDTQPERNQYAENTFQYRSGLIAKGKNKQDKICKGMYNKIVRRGKQTTKKQKQNRKQKERYERENNEDEGDYHGLSPDGMKRAEIESNLKVLSALYGCEAFIEEEVLCYKDINQHLVMWRNVNSESKYFALVGLENVRSKHAVLLTAELLNQGMVKMNLIEPLSKEDSIFTAQLKALVEVIELPGFIYITYAGVQDKYYGTCADMSLIMIQESLEKHFSTDNERIVIGSSEREAAVSTSVFFTDPTIIEQTEYFARNGIAFDSLIKALGPTKQQHQNESSIISSVPRELLKYAIATIEQSIKESLVQSNFIDTLYQA